MAVLTLSDRLAIEHQKQVATVAGGVTSGVVNIAMGADPLSVSTWFYAAIDALTARIQAGYALNRRSAMGYLPQHGALNGVTVHPVPGSLDTAALKARLNINGPVAFKTAIAAGRDEEEALRSMATQMGGLADEMVRNGDRDVITNTIRHGRGLVAYRRRLAGKSCGFCSMIASRGAVYTAETSTFRTHPHCRCWAEPVYRHEPEPPEVQRLARQWRRVTAGKHGQDAQRAWRHHWEQRATPQAKQRFGLAASQPGPGPGFKAPLPSTQVDIRPELQAARGAAQLDAAFRAEAKRITGRDISAYFGGSLQTAREHAEGVLRGLERFPDAKLRRVNTHPMTGTSAYAQAGNEVITFNSKWAGVADRQGYLDSLANDVKANWHPKGTDTPVANALHEFGHIIDLDTIAGSAHLEIQGLVLDAAELAGKTASEVIEAQVSRYALTNTLELAAEAFSDVMMNGPRASKLSREIFDVLVAEYKLGAGRTGIKGFLSPSLPALSEPAPLSAMKVTELRALAKERGLTGYSKLTKPQLLERLGGEAKIAVPKAAAVVDRYPLAPGYRGATAARRQREREEVLTLTRDAPGGARDWQGIYRERAEALESTGHLRRTASGDFTLTDKGREYFAVKGVAAPPATPAGDLSKLKVTELRALAKERGVTGYSKLTKPQLLDELRKPIPKAKAGKATAQEIATARGKNAKVPTYTIPRDLPKADLARIKDIIGTGEGISLSIGAVPGLGVRNLDLLLPFKARAAANAKELAQFVVGFRKQYPGLYEHLAHEAQVKSSYAEWRQVFKVKGTAVQVRKAMVEELRDLVSDAPIVVRRRRESSLLDILESGRMKTQFETGTSGGSLAPEMRAAFEQRTWGYARDLDPKLRPIYGYLSPAGVDAESTAYQAAQYGEIRIVLKDSVRQRTSFMVGDSLGASTGTPTAMDAPGWEAFNVSPGTGWRSPGGLGRDYASEAFQRNQYVETQIHGGVTVGDIAEVVFTHGYTPQKETIEALRRAGVPWRISRSRAR